MLVKNIPFDKKAIFINRQNKFLAEVKIDDKKELVHVHDPGRLTELLFFGNIVLLKKFSSKNRKTNYDIIAAKYLDQFVFINSKYHNEIGKWILKNIKPFDNVEKIKSEYKVSKSRFDFLIKTKEKDILVEIKGCTLAKDGIALFPDAPTKRGARHLEELLKLSKENFHACVIFLIFRKDAYYFKPNEKTDKYFSKVFYKVLKSNVGIKCYKFTYNGKGIYYEKEIPIYGIQ